MDMNMEKLMNVKAIMTMVNQIRNWNDAKELVLPMLIQKDGVFDDRTLVRNEYLDMTVIYYIKVEERSDYSAYLKITEELLKHWEISKEELHQAAMKNLLTLSEKEVYLETLIESMIVDLLPGDENIVLKDLPHAFDLKKLKGEKPDVYVLTNNSKDCGAALIMLPEMRRFVSERIGTDRYIVLPSSRHEVMIVPESVNFSLEYYKELVRSVNDTAVPVRDLLSYSVYANIDSELQKVA